MEKHIAICDIDGTLLTTSKTISNNTLNALIAWQQQGNLLILASGRPTTGMLSYAHILEMDKHNGLLISSNGACVVDVKSQEVLWEKCISHDIASGLLDHLESYDVIPMIAQEKNMIVNDVFKNEINYAGTSINIIQYEARGGGYRLKEQPHLKDALEFPLYKVLVAGDPEYLSKNASHIAKSYNDHLTSMFTAPFYYEFTHKGVDKAKALEFVIDYTNLSLSNTISFGDGDNDITLLKKSRVGIAMSNATQSLKEIANAITLSNDEDGIPHALNLYQKGAL